MVSVKFTIIVHFNQYIEHSHCKDLHVPVSLLKKFQLFAIHKREIVCTKMNSCYKEAKVCKTLLSHRPTDAPDTSKNGKI